MLKIASSLQPFLPITKRERIKRPRSSLTSSGPSSSWSGARHAICQSAAASSDGNDISGAAREIIAQSNQSGSIVSEDFCILESRESVRDFAALQIDEMAAGIQSRRNKIFLLMEEVRRLRIQQRIKGGVKSREEELREEQYPTAVPLLPVRTDSTLNDYWRFYLTSVSSIILFGGLLSPILKVKMGLGGTSYADFIDRMHLPCQLAEVDPIVASFCGGAVGVLTTLLLVELYNSDLQAKNRCIYCGGTGYVTCGGCSGKGNAASAEGVNEAGKCATCSGTGKVMCTGCLCTGKKVAHEHDARLDPFF